MHDRIGVPESVTYIAGFGVGKPSPMLREAMQQWSGCEALATYTLAEAMQNIPKVRDTIATDNGLIVTHSTGYLALRTMMALAEGEHEGMRALCVAPPTVRTSIARLACGASLTTIDRYTRGGPSWRERFRRAQAHQRAQLAELYAGGLLTDARYLGLLARTNCLGAEHEWPTTVVAMSGDRIFKTPPNKKDVVWVDGPHDMLELWPEQFFAQLGEIAGEAPEIKSALL